MSLGRVLLAFGQEGLGNPTRDAEGHAAKVAGLIQAKAPETRARVQPLIVFIDPRARVTADNPTVPVMDADDLKKWLRGSGKSEMLKTADYRAIESVFDAQAGDAVTTGDGAKAVKEKRPKRTYPRKR